MNTRIQIMDMDIDLLTKEGFCDAIETFLSGDSLSVVHMISLDYMDAYEQNELVQQVLSQADLVLPGEKTILSAHHADVLETAGMVVDYRCVLELAAPLHLEEKTFYLVLRDEKEARAVSRYLARFAPEENLVGVYVADGDMTEEALINDINTKLPDIILLSLDSTEQEEWLSNNKNKINTKLCFAAGSIMPLILRDNVYVPHWIRAVHLGSAYRFLLKIPYSHFFRKRIFKKRMDDYITKKKLEGNIRDDKKIQKDD